MSRKPRSRPIAKNGRLYCPICGCDYIHRLPRTTLAQRTYLTLFGLYPWECGQCKEPFLLWKRYARLRRHDSQDSTA